MRIVTCEQKSPEWWNVRKGLPSSSNFSRILTAKGKLSAQADDYICELIADQYRLEPPEEIVRYMSRAMENGVNLEAEARRYYQFETGKEVQQVGCCISDCGRFETSPDGLVDEDGLVEIKCPLHKTHVRYLLDGTLPDEYIQQTHGQLIVTGRQYCDFISYAVGLPLFRVRVTPSPYTDILRDALEKFHKRYEEVKAMLMAKWSF